MRLDTLVTVQRETAGAATALNTRSLSWPAVGQVYAAWAPGGVTEGEAAAQEQSVARGVLRVRRNELTASITTRDRLEFRGQVWGVTGTADADGKRLGEIDIHVIRRTDSV